jgi:dynein heavy chain 1
MQSQTFILDPPLAEARASLYTQLHEQIEVICGLRRVEAQRYGRYRGQENQRDQTYMGLVKQLNDYNISDAYESLENVLENAD